MENKTNILKGAGLIYYFIRRENQQRRRPKISQIVNALSMTRKTVEGHLNSRSPLVKRGHVSFEIKGRIHYFFTKSRLLIVSQDVTNNEFEESLFFLTSRGLTLAYIISNPGITIEDIAQKRCLTERTVWGFTGDLQRAKLIRVEKDKKNRRIHRYFFNGDGLTDFVAKLENEALETINQRGGKESSSIHDQ